VWKTRETDLITEENVYVYFSKVADFLQKNVVGKTEI
jgi:hypothetical protein